MALSLPYFNEFGKSAFQLIAVVMLGFQFTVNTVWPMSVPNFMRKSIVLCSTYTMSTYKSSRLLSHFLMSFLSLLSLLFSFDNNLATFLIYISQQA